VRVIGRAGQPARAEVLLGGVEHGRAVVVARAVADAFGENDQGDVLRVRREDLAVDAGRVSENVRHLFARPQVMRSAT
jgi:hypothetical protein